MRERGDIGGPSREPFEVFAGVQAPNLGVRRGVLLRSIWGIKRRRVCVVRREQDRGFRDRRDLGHVQAAAEG